MTPEALRRRMAHGNVYPAERVDTALANYFRLGNLGALRELALLWVADKVDESLHTTWRRTGSGDVGDARTRRRRAHRQPERRGAHPPGGPHGPAGSGGADRRPRPIGDGLARDDAAARGHRRHLEELGGTVHEVVAPTSAAAIVRSRKPSTATQLVVGATRSRWSEFIHGSFVARVLPGSGPIDVHVIVARTAPTRRAASRSRIGSGAPRPDPRGARRIGWRLDVVGPPVLVAMANLPSAVSTSRPSCCCIWWSCWPPRRPVVSGRRRSRAVRASSLGNWFFTPPYVHVHDLRGRERHRVRRLPRGAASS